MIANGHLHFASFVTGPLCIRKTDNNLRLGISSGLHGHRYVLSPGFIITGRAMPLAKSSFRSTDIKVAEIAIGRDLERSGWTGTILDWNDTESQLI